MKDYGEVPVGTTFSSIASCALDGGFEQSGQGEIRFTHTQQGGGSPAVILQQQQCRWKTIKVLDWEDLGRRRATAPLVFVSKIRWQVRKSKEVASFCCIRREAH